MMLASYESHETEPVDISNWQPAQFVNIPIEDLMYKNMSPSMESVVRKLKVLYKVFVLK